MSRFGPLDKQVLIAFFAPLDAPPGASKEFTVASNSRVHMARVHMKDAKSGLKRKKKNNKEGSTPTREVFFGETEKKQSK